MQKIWITVGIVLGVGVGIGGIAWTIIAAGKDFDKRNQEFEDQKVVKSETIYV